jgi:PAS domain S-box-containing protein
MPILPDFAKWTLRQKLVSIIMLSSAICVLISLSIVVVSSANSRYKDALQQLDALAEVLAENGQAALLFSDQTEAKRLLESLKSRDEISSAWLINAQGMVLSSWSRQGAAGEAPLQYRVTIAQLNSDFWTRRADLFRPVTRDKENIGFVVLRADFTKLWRSQWVDLGNGLAGAVFALLVVYLFALFMQRVISRPLGELAATARSIASDKRYSVRVPQPTEDEIGDLILAFNEMLNEIQHRDENLLLQRDHLEAEVDKRTAELRTILEIAPDIIARFDRNCICTYVNPAFAALARGGIPALIGKKPSEMPYGANAFIFEARLIEVFTTNNNTHFELKWRDRHGKETCTDIRLTAERDAAGKALSVLGVGRDISELKDFQAELQRKESAKTRFLAAAGHDLRQPLAAANLFIDALKFSDPTPNQEQIIQRLEQAMANFNTLLDALLNVSKLDAGMIKPKYTPIKIVELLQWLEQNLAPLAREKQLGFKLYFPLNEALVASSDLGLIQSVLMNLVSNAIKFTSQGSILISARRRGHHVLFQVWDTGLGINPEYTERIFDEFYQINNPQRDRTHGLGLGLSIVKRALLLLGEKITCRSTMGHGTVFGFSLPLNTVAGHAMHYNVNDSVLEANHQEKFVQGKRFVVVEDDALVAEAINIALLRMGAIVTLFHNAEMALHDAHIGEADYYIADFMLGGQLNGMQFLNQLSKKLGGKIIAVMMTGDTSPAFVREAAACAWPVLHKPVSLTRLITSIQKQED